MCSPNVSLAIDDVINQKISSNLVFTAFDVSLEVQSLLKARGEFDATQHRHRHLKDDVHRAITSYLNSGFYDRVLQDVGAPAQAYVYFPQGVDPTTYVPQKRNDTPVVSDPYSIPIPSSLVTPAAPVSAVSSTPVQSNGNSNDNDGDAADHGRQPDARGTLCISSVLLRAAGFQHNDTAYVYKGNDANGSPRLVICKSTPAGLTPLTKYTVDYHGNVRITKAILDQAQLVGPSYDFDADNVGGVFSEPKVFVVSRQNRQN